MEFPTLPCLAAILVASPFAAPAAPAAKDLAGDWAGTLNASSIQLHVVFHITKTATGWTATMDSIDQGVRGLPVDTVSLNGDKLRLEVKTVRGTFDGAVNPAFTQIAGQWKQGAGSLPLTLVRTPAGKSAAAETIPPAELAANKFAAQKAAGTWDGTLSAGGASLRLRVKIAKSGAGTAAGALDSLDQGATDIPLSGITLKEGKLRFEARGIGGVYEGTLAASGDKLTGQWQQAGRTFPLEFKKSPTAR